MSPYDYSPSNDPTSTASVANSYDVSGETLTHAAGNVLTRYTGMLMSHCQKLAPAQPRC
jgi:hypothetical protein